MSDEELAQQNRLIRIYTIHGSVEGYLHIGPQLRTLDTLNFTSKCFVRIHSAKSLTSAWTSGGGTLSVNKSSILFVRELSSPPVQLSGQPGGFTPGAVRMRVKDYELEGFVHVPPGGEAMMHLDRDDHPFVSLTTVLLSGPDEEVTTPFLAINREHIALAEETDTDHRSAAHETPTTTSSGV
jgi:hypothetical protein